MSDSDYQQLRQAVLDAIRSRGVRPDRTALQAQLHLAAPPAPEMVDRLVAEGLVRPEPQPADRERPERGSASGTGRSRPSTSEGSPFGASFSGVGIVRGLKRILKQTGRSDAEIYESYRRELTRRVDTERAGLAGHTTAYLTVNASLFGLWVWTQNPFPWFAIPLLGWGIGYITHRVSVRTREQELSQVTAMTDPTREQLQLHRRLWKVRRAFRGHVASNVMTMALLGTINIITGAAFPWALIPSGFMALGLVTHRQTSRREEDEIREQLNLTGFALPAGWDARGVSRRVGSSRAGSRAGNRNAEGRGGDDPASRARAIRAELLAEIQDMAEAEQPMGADFRDVLDTYVAQIEAMSSALVEIDQLIAGIPLQELETDRRRLAGQLESAANERLAAEYRRSIEQVDVQIQSHRELQTEREVLTVRTNTAIGALKQLRIDVARARSSRNRTAEMPLEELRRRSDDLRSFLNDLRDAYDEID
jgi:hypothetical protein